MSFYEDVYAVVRKIKPGCVVTYREVAVMAGRPGAARAVGTAMHLNPYEWGSSEVPRELWAPCHRVVAASGALAAGFGFGGCEEQKVRLEAEGVEVVPMGNGYRVKERPWREKNSLVLRDFVGVEYE